MQCTVHRQDLLVFMIQMTLNCVVQVDSLLSLQSHNILYRCTSTALTCQSVVGKPHEHSVHREKTVVCLRLAVAFKWELEDYTVDQKRQASTHISNALHKKRLIGV